MIHHRWYCEEKLQIQGPVGESGSDTFSVNPLIKQNLLVSEYKKQTNCPFLASKMQTRSQPKNERKLQNDQNRTGGKNK